MLGYNFNFSTKSIDGKTVVWVVLTNRQADRHICRRIARSGNVNLPKDIGWDILWSMRCMQLGCSQCWRFDCLRLASARASLHVIGIQDRNAKGRRGRWGRKKMRAKAAASRETSECIGIKIISSICSDDFQYDCSVMLTRKIPFGNYQLAKISQDVISIYEYASMQRGRKCKIQIGQISFKFESIVWKSRSIFL